MDWKLCAQISDKGTTSSNEEKKRKTRVCVCLCGRDCTCTSVRFPPDDVRQKQSYEATVLPYTQAFEMMIHKRFKRFTF
jgi:hypothetical protein